MIGMWQPRANTLPSVVSGWVDGRPCMYDKYFCAAPFCAPGVHTLCRMWRDACMCCSFEYSLLAAVVNGSSVGKVIAVEAKTDHKTKTRRRGNAYHRSG